MFGEVAASARLPLRLSIESHVVWPPAIAKDWQDTDELKLESVLPQAVASILVFGELHYRANAILHHEWLVESKRDQRRLK